MKAVLSFLFFFSALIIVSADEVEWVWQADTDRRGGGRFEVVQPFQLPEGVQQIHLRAAADFASLRVRLGEEEVLRLEAYDPTAEVDVTRILKSGAGELHILAEGVEGPSAIAVAIIADGTKVIGLNRSSRDLAGKTLAGFGPVEGVRRALPRLPEVPPFAEYNQWKEALESADKAALSPLPEGFEIERILEAAPHEGSWVSLLVAPGGDLLVGVEEKGILRLQVSTDRSAVTSVTKVEDTLKECRGLAWLGDTLYAHANVSKGLHALRDTDGDGTFDEVRLVQATEGGAGHGRNALAVHEGVLYAIQGDNIAVPEDSPRRAPREPGAPAELGHLARLTFESDGKPRWEALDRGLRNPYGVAFNGDGEPFTYDADNEGDAGLPFYRPTRINHLVSGANYGWHQDRGNTRSLPVYAPDSVPSNFDVGRGSPTGVKSGRASHFPAPWKNAIFALDWAYGRILAIHPTPHGASYHASGEVFLEGRPLNVTDLDFDAEGNLWFVTGGRKTKSALYRIRYRGPRGGVVGGEQEMERLGFSFEARKTRKSLESWHGRPDEKAIDAVWPWLGHPDPWLRNAARVGLEWQPVAGWRARALSESATLAGLTARLALARAGEEADREALAENLPGLALAPETTRIEALSYLRLVELCGSLLSAEARETVSKILDRWEAEPEGPIQRERIRAMVLLERPDAIAEGFARLGVAANQSDQLHYLEALSEARAGWTAATRNRFFQELVQARQFSNGDRFMPAFFDSLAGSALATISETAEADRFRALLAGSSAEELPAPAPRAFVRHWTLEDFEEVAPETVQDPAHLAKGREAYLAALCAQCHVCGDSGRPVGPDLSTVASRFSRRDLLEAILEPSAVVSEVHRNVVVTRTDGSVVQGRIVRDDFRESKLVLGTNPFVPEELLTLPKSEIRSWEESPVSPMPPALLNTLEKSEIEALLDFLMSGGAEN